MLAPGLTPKALANLSPGLERQRQPWVTELESWSNPFRVKKFLVVFDPGLSLALQPWANISQRLRRFGCQRPAFSLADAFGSLATSWAFINAIGVFVGRCLQLVGNVLGVSSTPSAFH